MSEKNKLFGISKSTTIEIDGTAFHIKRPSNAQFAVFVDMADNDKVQIMDLMFAIVSCTWVDDRGDLVLSADDKEAFLNEGDASTTMKLGEEIQKFIGLGDEQGK